MATTRLAGVRARVRAEIEAWAAVLGTLKCLWAALGGVSR